jgi:hypothetical protein
MMLMAHDCQLADQSKAGGFEKRVTEADLASLQCRTKSSAPAPSMNNAGYMFRLGIKQIVLRKSAEGPPITFDNVDGISNFGALQSNFCRVRRGVKPGCAV